MLTEDYLVRMINLAIAALLRILGLKEGGDYQEALMVIDMTFELMLGLRASMVKNLDDDRLYFLLTRNDELDTRRLELVADLFHQEADIYAATGRPQESQDDYRRALKYYLEVFFSGPPEDPSDLIQKTQAVIQAVGADPQPPDVLWPLAGFYEETGALAQAETVLLDMAARPELHDEILPELIAFYRRVLAKPAPVLSAGGLDVEQVKAKLAGLSKPEP